MAGVFIKNFTRRPAPRVPFAVVAKKVLPGWDISLVFIGEKRAKDLNIKLRRKNYVPNVLSYTVGQRSGEIIICLKEVAHQASSFQLPVSSFQLLVFIHGLLHIKGWSHSATMEKCEQNLLAHYVAANSNRHRHRHISGQTGRR